MKQETLEEAAQKRFPINHNLSILERMGLNSAANMGFIEGAKWQAERSYTFDELRLWSIERDVYLYNYYTTYKKAGIPMENVDKYIEDSHEYLMGRKQFKKK